MTETSKAAVERLADNLMAEPTRHYVGYGQSSAFVLRTLSAQLTDLHRICTDQQAEIERLREALGGISGMGNYEAYRGDNARITARKALEATP